ncbi:kinase-like protein, partial [Rhizoctonia solani]
MSIKYESRAVASISREHPNLPNQLANLGESHNSRFERLGELDDLETAIQYQTHALELTSDSHPDLPHWLDRLALSQRARFRRLGDLKDLNMAIDYASRALSLTPDSHSDLPSRFANLGITYNDRFEHLGEPGDLKKAIEHQSHAVSSTPDGHPDFSERLAYLGSFYESRFLDTGELDDLERAIEYESRALSMCSSGHPALRYQLANLGGSYYVRFLHLGQLNDLEKAIEYQSRALTMTPCGHVDLPRQLAVLGASHSDRFRCLGWLGDLKLAIEFKTRSLDLTPNDHPEFASQLANLGVSYSERFKRLGDLSDAKKAIEYQSQALQMTPENHPDLPYLLASLAATYSSQYQQLKRPGDLDKAIEYMSQAISLAPEGSHNLSHQLASLGTSYSARFQLLGNPDDRTKAIESQSLAVTTPLDYHAFSFWKLVNLRAPYNNPSEHPKSGTNTLDPISRSSISGSTHLPSTRIIKELSTPKQIVPTTSPNHATTIVLHHSCQLKRDLSDGVGPILDSNLISDTSTNINHSYLACQQAETSTTPTHICKATSRLDIELTDQSQFIDAASETKTIITHNGGQPLGSRALIGVSMTIRQVITHLVEHGCPDLANDVDHTTFGEHPTSNGGFSDVYRGYLHNKAKVAIKVLRISAEALATEPKHLKHAARELHTWSKCTHPNVLRLYGLVEFRNRIGMVSAWMEQGNLPRYLQETPDVDRCNLCIQICDGLSFMHQIGIIHGDLKGANVLISDDGVPVLADFGNSLYADQTLKFTQTTSVNSLTVGWAAPELLFDSGVPSKEADVYSLGMHAILLLDYI